MKKILKKSFLIIFLCVIVSIIILNLTNKRSRFLRGYSKNAGFNFIKNENGTVSEKFYKGALKIPLFEKARIEDKRKIFNIITGTYDNIDIEIFDYRYDEYYSMSNRVDIHYYTVMHFHSTDFGLPVFSLKPKEGDAKLMAKIGYRDLSLEEYSEFSRVYHLRGHEKDRIRRIFNSMLTEKLIKLRKKSIVLESLGDDIVIYKKGLLNKEEFESCIKEYISIADIFIQKQL